VGRKTHIIRSNVLIDYFTLSVYYSIFIKNRQRLNVKSNIVSYQNTNECSTTIYKLKKYILKILYTFRFVILTI